MLYIDKFHMCGQVMLFLQDTRGESGLYITAYMMILYNELLQGKPMKLKFSVM